jgi:serine/threonine protein kinase
MPQPSDKIDKYQIISVLGKGAMGIVYHAFDPVVKRDVAIKFLSSLDTEETELISRFEREARLAGGLRHPNVVTIYDLGHWEARPYIVMEYIVGRDLEAVIKEKQPLITEQRIEIILQICKGLDAAHQKGIIHRDIKPANVRIQDDNTVKIMDFGIARMGTSQLTRSGYIIGTLQYMSPEQISGEQLDPRTDLFSTGVIAYELFTYLNPFSGGAAVDIMYRILNVKPKPIDNLPEDFGSELNQIILRAIEKNRDIRYQTAREMAQDLEEVLFYLKTLKFRPKGTSRVPAYAEGMTQNIPPEQMPVTPRRDPEIAPTIATDIPPPNVPAFGQTVAEKAPRTGTGANYSETGQMFLKETRSSRKFYILGALVALLFIGGMLYVGLQRNQTPAPSPLVVNSTPPGADVLIDGQKVGVTPYGIVEPKDVSITLRLQGYQDRAISLSKNAWPVAVPSEKLEPAPVSSSRTIAVQSVPPGATVLLDGQEFGVTPAQLTLADSKPHQLGLRLQGYAEEKRTIDQTSPNNLTVPMQAAAEPGFIKYVGQIPVVVFVDGKPAHGTSLEAEPGTHTVSIRARGNALIRMSREVNVKSGDTSIIQQPAMGTLSIRANPSNCKIFVDGEFIDYPPITNLPVQTGTHAITFNWEKLSKKSTKSVVISADQGENVMGVPSD